MRFFVKPQVATVTTALVAAIAIAGLVDAHSIDHSSADLLIPFSAIGNVAAIQGSTPISGDTRIFFQAPNSTSIIQGVIQYSPLSQPHGSSFSAIVPANEVMAGTPLAVVTVNGTALQEFHLYFLSPSSVLSEYIWTTARGLRGGPSCTECITAQGFVAASSKILYAMGDPFTANLRVGFVSAGVPSGLTEAYFSRGAGWSVGQL